MAVFGYLLRARLRRRWRSIAALAIVVGVITGAILTGASGARRTETAFDRFVVSARATPLIVSTYEGGGYEPIASIPGVTSLAPVVGYGLYPVGLFERTDVITNASVDGSFGYEVDRPNIVAGRMPHPERAEEVLVNPQFAATYDLGAGDRLTLAAQSVTDYVQQLPPDPDTTTFDVLITGVGVATTEVVPTTDLDALPGILATPAMHAALLDAEVPPAFDGVAVTLAPGTDQATVIKAVEEALGVESTFILDLTTTHATVERAIRPQANALWMFVAVLALVAALVVVQAVARHAAIGAAEDAPLAALGVGRRWRTRFGALEGAIIGTAGAVVAVLVAGILSSQFPIGKAAIAEPHPGFALNLAVLAVGVVALVALTTSGSALSAAWASSTGAQGVRHPSRIATAAASMGGGPQVVLGLRRAFESGNGATAVPVRSGLAGAVLAVAAVTAAATFAVNLDRLVTDPTRYGQTWTASIDGMFGAVPAADIVDRYGKDPLVEGVAGINYGELQVEGHAVPVIAFDVLAGELGLTILEGREPNDEGEMALGTRTLDELGASVDDELTVRTPSGPQRWRIVGRAVFPQLGQGVFNSLGLGTGGVVPGTALQSPYVFEEIEEMLASEDDAMGWEAEDFFVRDRAYNAVVLRAAPGSEAQLAARVADDPASITGEVRTLQRPAAISTYADVRGTPVVLALVLSGVAALLIVHVLLTSVRRRRRELATCRAIGMRGGEVRAVVRWQATVLAGAAVIVGVPVGLGLGRGAWSLFAGSVGVPTNVAVPWAWLAVAILGTVVVANLAGLLPAHRAGRVPPAVALRAE